MYIHIYIYYIIYLIIELTLHKHKIDKIFKVDYNYLMLL